MLYKALKRRQAAEAAGDAEAAGITIPCPACAGKHRAHTCARGLTQPRAAPGAKAATAARLGAATAAPARQQIQFERIEDQEEIDEFFDVEHMRERQLEMLREERLTVAANAYGECCSLMFLSTSGKFRDKISMLQELGDRAASMGTNVKVLRRLL